MKKLITIISLMILCLTISSCGLKESVVEGLSQKMYNEITEAYIEYCKEYKDRTITNENFKIDMYFGEYNETHVVLIHYLARCPDYYDYGITIGEHYFNIYCSEYIYVYYNDKLYGIKTAYEENLLSEEDIEDISNKFKEYR